MTKKELAEALENGKTMCELFQFSLGQECDVFKADDFKVGDEILYISDMYNCRLYIRPIKGMDDNHSLMTVISTSVQRIFFIIPSPDGTPENRTGR